MYNKTLGIVGLGTIGKKTAKLARAFGMRVQYYDVTRLSEEHAEQIGVRFALLEELLKTSDIVSLHVPLLAETRHMMNAERRLKMMKPSAYLINTCRGPVVDEPASGRGSDQRHDRRCRARCVRSGAAAAEQSVVRFAERCCPDGAFRRTDVGHAVFSDSATRSTTASASRGAKSRCGLFPEFAGVIPRSGHPGARPGDRHQRRGGRVIFGSSPGMTLRGLGMTVKAPGDEGEGARGRR